MKQARKIFFFFALANSLFLRAQVPVFSAEIPVTINGITTDAMEPFISPDGITLFYNSLNDGQTTSLYYAVRLNDSTFSLAGEIGGGCNQTTTPRLNAVASMDSTGNFYSLTLRNYPNTFQNYFRSVYSSGSVTDTGRVYGNIYVYAPGWLIMDAATNYRGDLFYYCNAYFNGCSGLPCKGMLGIGQKNNDSTFTKLLNSDTLLKNINDTMYVVYAPQVSANGLELYFTRYSWYTTLQTEICVAVRSNTSSAFGTPVVIYTTPNVAEAATITTDMTKIYYHRKQNGIYKIFMRYRNTANDIRAETANELLLYPNPVANVLNIETAELHDFSLEIYNALGEKVLAGKNVKQICTQQLERGIYFLKIANAEKMYPVKFVKE